jgi:hypothetical protein
VKEEDEPRKKSKHDERSRDLKHERAKRSQRLAPSTRTIMDLENLTSVNQTSKNPRTTSEKYRFIPTRNALDVLAGFGWQPVEARESSVKKSENLGYQRHLIKLRNDRFADIAKSGVQPEIVLINSHGGASSFLLFAAFHELVCRNGLIIHHDTAETRIAHVGYADERVAEALSVLGEMFPRLLGLREEWREIRLDLSQQIGFATAAAALRFPERPERVEPSALLVPRHSLQSVPTLWNTMNVVQENLIRGGIRSTTPKGRRAETRPIRGIESDVRLNRALWQLAENTAQAVQV